MKVYSHASTRFVESLRKSLELKKLIPIFFIITVGLIIANYLGVVPTTYTLTSLSVLIVWTIIARSPQIIYNKEMQTKQLAINEALLGIFVSCQHVFCGLSKDGSEYIEFQPKIKIRYPQVFKSNTEHIHFDCPALKLSICFLPDAFLISINGKPSLIEYDYIVLSSDTVDGYWGKNTTDSQLISEHWLYENKNGSPDKRRKDNILLREYRYGLIIMNSLGIKLFRFYFSNPYVVDSELVALKNCGFMTTL